MSDFENEIVRERKEKLAGLVSQGVEPYGRKFVRSHSLKVCSQSFQEGLEVKVAGRVVAFRAHGKSVFGHLQDKETKLQFYIKKDLAGEALFDLFLKVDLGDVLGLEGSLFKTHTGETTVLIKNFVFLAKALRPLPEKWHGLKDVEIRYRQRYVDLISNQDVRRIFQMRSGLIRQVRSFLDAKGFQEVETPMMQSIPGGAVAKPFITHHEALDLDLYLRIAPELYLKRLLVGGLEKVYELNRNFRNEGLSRFHNPEFTMLEVYSAYDDYEDMMNLTENLFVELCDHVIGKREISWGGDLLRFDPPWQRLDYFEAIQKYTGLDPLNLKDPASQAKKMGLFVDPSWTRLEIINEIFDKRVQEKLIQPSFVIDYPVELCPLAKTKKSDPSRAERFELFIHGMEVANAYSELNDPVEQAKRFEEQAHLVGKGSDMDFVRALEYGMPCAGGLGIGMDRMVMILTGAESIREVVFFPQLRPE
ncbi:MAG: lysine--tRNA ligase [Chlamydiae bacterium]|nr:lysine--tRNA ligase [Chlamydiota bacterium]MBI3265888.1 lysine--tRNA ligase [Chlamydiota bacterium]